MKNKVLLSVLSMLLSNVAAAYEENYLQNAKALYKFDNVFLGGLLMYRPENTQRLEVFDLSKAQVLLIKRGPPDNCMELIINGPDGLISGGCVPNTIEKNAK